MTRELWSVSDCLAGRDPELAVVERGLKEAASGRGGVILISGQPGAGKSSLLSQLTARARGAGFSILSVRCVPPDVPGAESPWLQFIRGCFAALPAGAAGESWQACCPGLAPRAGALAQRQAQFNDCPPGECLLRMLPGEPLPFRAICRFVASISHPRPLLLTVDDLHHADEAALELLHFASHGFHDLRVLIAAAYRDCAMAGFTRAAVEAMQRQARHIDLAPLGAAATAQLLAQITGEIPQAPVIDRVCDLTGGNIRLICEIEPAALRQLETARSETAAPVTAGMQAAVCDWLAVLSAEAMEMLGVAAVIGPTFEVELALSVVGLSGDHAFRIVAELERAGLISPVKGSRYRFAQVLVREVLYEQCLSARKAFLHQRIAVTLEARHGHDLEAHAGELTRHLLASRNAGAARKAIDYAAIAGRRAERECDFNAAAAMYAMALQALELGGDTDDARRVDLLMALGNAQAQAGDGLAAQQNLFSAAEIALRLTDRRRLTRIIADLPADPCGLSASPNRRAILLAQAVLDSPRECEPAQRALVAARLAAELSYQRDQWPRCRELADHALDLVAAQPEPRLRVLHLRDYVLRHPDAISERLAVAAEVAAIASQRADYGALFSGALAQAVSHFELGDIGRAEAAFELAEHAGAMAGRPLCRAIAAGFKTMLAAFDGRLAEAEDLYFRCRNEAAARGMPELGDQCWPAMIVPLGECQRLGELEPAAASTFRRHPKSPVYRALCCWLAWRQGNALEAGFHLERLAVDNFAGLRYSGGCLAAAALLAEVCAGLGNVAHHAAAVYELLLPYKDRNIILAHAAAFGSASRYLGIAAAALSRNEDALGHFQDALNLNTRLGARTWAAYSRFELAGALRSRAGAGDRERAAELLGGARAEALTLGMRTLAAACQRELGVTGLDGFAGRAAPKTGSNNVSVDLTAPAPPTSATADPPASNGTSGAKTVSNMFRLEGELWAARYDAKLVGFRPMKGIALIAHLLRHPRREFHAIDLAALVDPPPPRPAAESAHGGGESDLGPLLDAAAKQSYRQRLHELREELEEAQSFNDLERASKLEEEMRFLTRELARAVGLRGRDRKAGSQAERARLRVTNSIKLAIAKISKHHGSLGRHLARHIRTGTFCSYVPDSDAHIDWDL